MSQDLVLREGLAGAARSAVFAPDGGGPGVVVQVAAGVADHVWGLLEGAEQAVPMKRGPYKRRAA